MDNLMESKGNEIPLVLEELDVVFSFNFSEELENTQNEAEKNNLAIVTEEYPQEMELKVVMQREITTYLHRSLPLCVILAYEKYLPWYYSDFIQVFSHTNEMGFVELNYLEPRDCYGEIVDLVCLGYHLLSIKENIIDFIIENINLGYYLIINVDEYYLPVKHAYKTEHYVHSSLIYGYDNQKQQLKAIGFDNEYIFTNIIFDYNQFSEAYENAKIYYKDSAPWCGWSAVQLIKPKNIQVEYPFIIERFLNELKSYLFSIGDNARLYSFEYLGSQADFGFQVYDVIIRNLENLLKGKFTLDYRAIHLISEHKKCMYDRLEYVITRNKLSGKIVELLEAYTEVVDLSTDIRLKSLALYYANLDISTLSSDQECMINNVIQMIKDLKDMEYYVLINIYQQLEQDLK